MIQIDNNKSAERGKRYNKIARKYPAYIGIGILAFVGVAMGFNDKHIYNIWMKAAVYVLSISVIVAALLFFYRMFLRDISKFYPGKILFCDRLKPTTSLLYSSDDTFSEEKKKQIRAKIKSKKGIDLQTFKKKNYKNKNYVKRVDEAVDWLLDVTRFDDILFEYNCFYGAYRNVTAAIAVDALLLFLMAVVNKWWLPLTLGQYMVVGGIALFFLSAITAILAYINGGVFAKKLYDVFMNLNDDKNNY